MIDKIKNGFCIRMPKHIASVSMHEDDGQTRLLLEIDKSYVLLSPEDTKDFMEHVAQLQEMYMCSKERVR